MQFKVILCTKCPTFFRRVIQVSTREGCSPEIAALLCIHYLEANDQYIQVIATIFGEPLVNFYGSLILSIACLVKGKHINYSEQKYKYSDTVYRIYISISKPSFNQNINNTIRRIFIHWKLWKSKGKLSTPIR